jgi:protein involved in polysaccharide export with SLBB domain
LPPRPEPRCWGDNRYGGQQRASQQLILARNLSRDQLADLSNRFGGTQSQVISTYYDTPGQAAVDSLTRSRAFRAATTAGSDRFVRTVKEQARQAFDYATTLPATTQAARVLESGDRVEIAYGEDRVHLTRVNEKGEVVIPSVGPVTAWGKTPPELAKDITDAYQKAGQPRPTTVNVRAQPALSSPTTNKTYALRSGDTVTVHYGYENPDLRYTREALVDANGLITLPMLGELEAKGKTPQELAAQVARAAARFEPGRATFTCAVRNTAGEMITGSAPSAGATTRMSMVR